MCILVLVAVYIRKYFEFTFYGTINTIYGLEFVWQCPRYSSKDIVLDAIMPNNYTTTF